MEEDNAVYIMKGIVLFFSCSLCFVIPVFDVNIFKEYERLCVAL